MDLAIGKAVRAHTTNNIAHSGTCGGEFTDANGHLSSPSYPDNYPSNADCIYTFSQPTGSVILLNFVIMGIHQVM